MEKVYIKEKERCSTMDKYLKPEFIYIPLDNNNYSNYDYIYKNDLISKKNYSPVSGYIVDYTNKEVDGRITKCIVIENDYKEKYKNKKYNFNKEIFINTLKANNYIEEYDNYDIEYLVINAIDIEPYIFSKRYYINNQAKDILFTIDNIINKLNISKAIITIVEDSLYNNLNKYIGTYPNIKIIKVNNYYPVSNNKLLLKEIFNITYDKTSLEKKIWILNLLSLINIDNIIKKNISKYEKIITIGGNCIKNTVIRVKIGTSFKEIIDYLGGYNSNNISITIGGPICGKQVDKDDFIITDSINSIFITKKKSTISKECTMCSKCHNVCPVNLVPVFIMKNINNKENLKKLNIDKCLECNLCSYICPSNINLGNYINRAKEEVNNE